MKRHSTIRIFNQCMDEGDIGVFIGDGICRESYAYDRRGNLYMSDRDNIISLALGLAMCSNRRVFVFCDDSYVLRNLSELAHIAVSQCDSLYLVILVSGVYIDIGKHPNIFNSIMAPRSMFYNMGFLVHNYTKHFKNTKNPIKEIKAIWSRAKGPLVATVDVDLGLKNLKDDYPVEIDSLNDLSEFIQDESILAYNYESPISFTELVVEE
jgi:hypothetical protein